jgi:AcrR family transcriptional regulator
MALFQSGRLPAKGAAWIAIIELQDVPIIADGMFAMKKIASKINRKASPAAEIHLLGSSSKDRLFQSAEALFSAKGFRDVSVREIAAHAGVNLALVTYYFSGKQALFDEVFRSHAAPLAQERMKQLAAITQNGRKPSIEEILKAWLLPWLQLGNDPRASAIHLRLTANLSHERWAYTKKVSGYLQRTHRAFIKALHSRIPYLSEETLMWRLHFVMGALVFGIRQPAPLTALSGGRCNPTDLEATFNQILPYAAAGFRAREATATKR